MHAKPPPPPVHNDKDALHDMSSQIKAFVIFLVAFIALFLYSKSSVGVTFAHQLLKKIDLDKYLVSTSDTDIVTTRRDAAGRLAEDLARQIVDDVVGYKWKNGKE